MKRRVSQRPPGECAVCCVLLRVRVMQQSDRVMAQRENEEPPAYCAGAGAPEAGACAAGAPCICIWASCIIAICSNSTPIATGKNTTRALHPTTLSS